MKRKKIEKRLKGFGINFNKDPEMKILLFSNHCRKCNDHACFEIEKISKQGKIKLLCNSCGCKEKTKVNLLE